MNIAVSNFKDSGAASEMLARLNASVSDIPGHSAGHVTEVRIIEDMAAIEEDWRKLEAGAHVSLHQSYAWCKAWVDAMTPKLAIVTGLHNGRVVFILPLEIVRGRLGRIARFIGAPYSNLNTGLYHQSFAHSVTDESVRNIGLLIARAMEGRADVLQLANMPEEWRGVRNPFNRLPSIENQNCAYQLPLLATFEETLAQLNAKRKRKRFRSTAKKLEAHGGYEHVVATGHDDAVELVNMFFHQKAVRFQALGLPNVFKDESIQAFFRNAATAPGNGANYSLQLHALRLNDGKETIAAIAGLSRKGDHIICQFGSIDEDAAPGCSVGELLFHLMIEDANADHVALFDFGIGDQLYKRNWCTIETPHRDILMPLSIRGRLGILLLSAMTRTKAAIKKNERLYAALQKLRAAKDAAPASSNSDCDD